MSKLKALVVGGSLAGLTTAIALNHAGLEISLFEKKPAMSGTAGGLGVTPYQPGDSQTAKFLKSIIIDEGEAALASYDHVAKKWEDLYDRLFTYARANTDISFYHDSEVDGINQDESQAYLTCQGQTYQADLIIGADGHRSIVRPQVDPDKPDATYAGYLNWMGSVNERFLDPRVQGLKYPIGYENVVPGPNKILIGFMMPDENGHDEPGKRNVLFAQYDALSNHIARRIGALQKDKAMFTVQGKALLDSEVEELVRRAEEDPWPEPFQSAMVYALKRREVKGILLKEYVPDRLYRGRLAIVGDAAHVATSWTGMGYNASLQDAASLAENFIHLDPSSQEVSQVLAAYEGDRLAEVRRIVQSGQSFSSYFRVEHPPYDQYKED